MRSRIAVVSCLLLLSSLALAQKAAQSAKGDFEADFPSGGRLSIHIRSGAVAIEGSHDNRISVRYEGENAGRANEVSVKLRASGKDGTLGISGGPHNQLRIIVQIPRNTDLYLRMPAGQLEIRDVAGNKDVELSAGEMTVAIGDPNSYAHIDTSVYSGELDARCFDVSKGGLFRSFQRTGTGIYSLHAHVGAGQLTLQ